MQDGKLFCAKLKHLGGGVNDFWCTIGGGLNEQESLLDGLMREVIEETGITPVIGKLLYVQQYRDDVQEHMEFFYEVTNAQDFINIDLSKSSHGAAEIDAYDFVDPTAVSVLPKFLQAESYNDISAQPTRFFSYL